MNLFYTSVNPQTAAQYQCDKHVVKMILETAQMLSTAHRLTETPQAPFVYKPTTLTTQAQSGSDRLRLPTNGA